MSISCKVCGAEVFDYENRCVRCTWPQGFPNVRIADSRDERKALDARARRARRHAVKSGAGSELDRLIAMAEAAPIAFNRKLIQLFQWCQEPDQCFRPWLWKVAQGQRVIPDKFNIGRMAFEHNVNPGFSDNINFGYLDVGDQNGPSYGPYKVRFHTAAVSRRTTFLETNAYYFCHEHGVVDPSLVPPGYRASWKRSGKLAEAKLGGKVRSGMSDSDLQKLLVRPEGDGVTEDFLEAHIYNPLHISAIESVRGPEPSPEETRMWEYVTSTLTGVGVTVKVLK